MIQAVYSRSIQIFQTLREERKPLAELFWRTIGAVQNSPCLIPVTAAVVLSSVLLIAFRFFCQQEPISTIRMGMPNFKEMEGLPGDNLCWLNSSIKLLAMIPGIQERLTTSGSEFDLALSAVIKELRSQKEGVLEDSCYARLIRAIKSSPDYRDGQDSVGVTMGDSCTFINRVLSKLYQDPTNQFKAYCKISGAGGVFSHENVQFNGVCFTFTPTSDTRLIGDGLCDWTERDEGHAESILFVDLPEVMAIRIGGNEDVQFSEDFLVDFPLFKEERGAVAQVATAYYAPVAAIFHESAHYTAVIHEEGCFIHHSDERLTSLSSDEGKALFAKARYLLLKRVEKRDLDQPNPV